MVKLTDYKREHLENTYQWMQDKNLKEMFLLDRVISLESHENWFTSIIKDDSQEIYAIEFGDVHVGNIGLKNIDIQNQKAEIWIYLGDLNYRGRGIAKAAILELLDMKKHDLKKIYAHVVDYNFASLKLFLSTNFNIEAFLRKEIVFKNRSLNLFRLYKLL
jgi:diamine N-acetyltransferase